MAAELKRVYGLDILRAVAILCVLHSHGLDSMGNIPKWIIRIAPDGVLLFFVLSGFLIGQILLKVINKSTSFSSLLDFWKRRWLRTLPAYFFVLIIIIVFNLFANAPYLVSEYARYFFFLQNITYGQARIFGESWSLSVEEWFYLTVPIAVFLTANFTRIPKKNIVLFWALFIIVSVTAMRIYRSHDITNFAQYGMVVRRIVPLRLDCIMFGVVGAWLKYYKYNIWNKKKMLFLIGLSLMFLDLIYFEIFVFDNYRKYFYFITESIAVLMLLPKLDSVKKGSGVVYRSVTYISKVSYSLYLVNATLYSLVIHSIIPQNLLNPTNVFISFYSWAFGASYLLYRFIEKPFMDLRDRKKQKFEYLAIKNS